jgi:glycosyltransferase involved in cell wall biosynthesis
VSDDVLLYLREQNRVIPGGRIEYFPLGSDFGTVAKGEPSKAVRGIFGHAFSPTFLVVGTLEPRKSQATVLDAFELLWQRGDASRLILVGREGFGSHVLARRILRHPERGRRLIWLSKASDADLELCYRNATALINVSRHEGFGLPIVEAQHRGLAVIASDIPVFREVGGDRVAYVPPDDEIALAKAIEGALRPLPQRSPEPAIAWSWASATEALIAQLVEERLR